jgi:hypothetical protein
MKIPSYSSVFIVFFGASCAYAQTPNPTFAGVYVDPGYVAVPAVREPDVYPMTAAGRAALERFDLFATPNQLDDCADVPMPDLIFNGDPMEMIQQDGQIVFHYERLDTRRIIHMDGAPPPADHPHSVHGYSVGRWVGNDELVVETTRIFEGVIKVDSGHPISRDMRLTERYWREPGSRDLRVEIRVDDPVYYTDTVVLGRELAYTVEEEVRPWGCVNLGPKDEEPDIDELLRMLEELEQ